MALLMQLSYHWRKWEYAIIRSVARSPSPEKQRAFILSAIKEWSNRLKLAEWKFIVLFAREKDDFEINGHFVGLGMTQLFGLGDLSSQTTSYRAKIGFREFYYPEDWEEYDSFYHMAETTVIHELLHVKMAKALHSIRHLVREGEQANVETGRCLQEEEWLVDNLARTLYDLKYPND